MASEGLNSPAWWDEKGQKYVAKNDLRDRPHEFEIAAEWCTGSVIEIGPALGAFSAYLPDNVQYLGVDCSKYLVAEARKRHPNRIFVEGSVLKLGEHWKKAFGTAVAMQTLEHFTRPDFEEALRRMVMVARDRLIVSVPRGMPSPSDRKNDGHLIGWLDDRDFGLDLSRYGEVVPIRGAENHICAVLNLRKDA